MDKMQLLKGLLEHTETEDKKEKVLETYQMRDSWKKVRKDMKDQKQKCLSLMDQLHKETCKMQTKKNAFWAVVESELDIYDKRMRLNEETNEIEVIEEVE